MIRVPKSAMLCGKCGPGQDMNMSDGGMLRRRDSAATFDGTNWPRTKTWKQNQHEGSFRGIQRTRSIVISGNASSRTNPVSVSTTHRRTEVHLLFQLASISGGIPISSSKKWINFKHEVSSFCDTYCSRWNRMLIYS